MGVIYDSTYDEYLRLRIEYSVTQDFVANTSDVTWSLRLEALSGNWYNIDEPPQPEAPYYRISVNGSTPENKYHIFDFRQYRDLLLTDEQGVSYTETIHHNASGNASITFYASFRTFLEAYGVSGTLNIPATTIQLPQIDRSPATITQNEISNVTSTTFNISAYSDLPCKDWEYTLDNGSTWVSITDDVATSVSLTASGLTPNRNYTVKFSATRVSNEVVGYSGNKTAQTKGGMLFTSVTPMDLVTDSAIRFRANVYNADYTNKLVLKYNGTTILSEWSIGSFPVSTNLEINATLTSAQKNLIGSNMSAEKSREFTLEVHSYDGATEKSDHSITMTVVITDSAKPTLGVSSYADINPSTLAVTGDSTKIISGYSTLRISGISASYQNGATFGSLKFRVGTAEDEVTTWATSHTFTQPVTSQTLTVTLTDSRGYSDTKSIPLTLISYIEPRLSYAKLMRRNSAEAETHLTMEGSFTYLSGSNSIQSATITLVDDEGNEYTHDLMDDAEWSYPANGAFKYNGGDIGDYDADKKFTCTIEVSDKLATVTYISELLRGSAVLSIRNNVVRVCNTLLLYDNINAIEADLTISGTDWQTLETWYNAH